MKRALWCLLILLLGMITVFAELDRQARKTPWLGAYVPTAFQSFELAQTVAQEANSPHPQDALDDAQRLVRQRPVPAEHLLALAQIEMASGNDKIAVQALNAAASRGWRDPMVQMVVAQSAEQAGAWMAAAQRVAALWAIEATDGQRESVTVPLIQDRQGQAALASVMAQNVPARNAILIWLLHDDRIAAATSIAAAAIAQGANFDCGVLHRLAHAAAISGAASDAARLWPKQCDDDPAHGLRQIAFAPRAYGSSPGPFDWTFVTNRKIDARLSEDRTLSFHGHFDAGTVVASKLVGFAPGDVGIVLGDSGQSPVAHVTLACLPGQRELPPRLQDGASHFTVPALACDGQVLTIVADASSGKTLRISIAS